jgi:hypothetical protein
MQPLPQNTGTVCSVQIKPETKCFLVFPAPEKFPRVLPNFVKNLTHKIPGTLKTILKNSLVNLRTNYEYQR